MIGRGAVVGLGFLLASVSGWADEHNTFEAALESLDDLVEQMSDEQMSDALAASYVYNIAAINLMAVLANQADMLEYVPSLMKLVLAEYETDLTGVEMLMLSMLNVLLEKAVKREQQRE